MLRIHGRRLGSREGEEGGVEPGYLIFLEQMCAPCGKLLVPSTVDRSASFFFFYYYYYSHPVKAQAGKMAVCLRDGTYPVQTFDVDARRGPLLHEVSPPLQDLPERSLVGDVVGQPKGEADDRDGLHAVLVATED